MNKNDVRQGIAIEFGDGVSRTIRPLTLKQLRKFVVVIEKLGSTENASTMTDDDIDTMVDAAEIILAKVDPALAADRDALEEAVDLVAFNKMMNVAMGASSPEE